MKTLKLCFLLTSTSTKAYLEHSPQDNFMFVSSVATCPYDYDWTCGNSRCSMWYGIAVPNAKRLANWRGKHVKYGWPLCDHWMCANLYAGKTDTYLEAIQTTRNDWQEHALAFAMGIYSN